MLIVGGALLHEGTMCWLPYLLALLVALSAQIASNLANDYFDYRDGKDTDRRVGFERLLTTGQVTPRQMLYALMLALAVCAVSGLVLCALCGWELLIVGLLVLLGVLAYSAGPYPLSSHGLGDLAVVLFYGLVPALVTYYAIAGMPPIYLYWLALGIGVWSANILVANNYRDYEEDRQSGKRTLIVQMGKRFGPRLYCFNAVLAWVTLSVGVYFAVHSWSALILVALLTGVSYYWLCTLIHRLKGRKLNYLLKATTLMSLLTSILILILLLLH